MKFIKGLFITLFILIFLVATSAYVIVTHYKKELAGLFIETMKKDHGLDLSAEDIRVSFFSNWPHASVQLKNVQVRSDKFADSYIKAGGIGLSFNIQKMLHKEFIVKYVSVSNAEIIFVKPQFNPDAPATNVPEDTAASAPITFEISRINLKNTRFRFLNPRIGQQIAINFIDNTIKLDHFSDGVSAQLKGRLYIPGLLFNGKRGEFLKESKARVNLAFDFFKDSTSICVRPGSYADVNGHRYNVSALVKLGENRKLSLIVDSKEINYEKTARLMNPRIKRVLSNFDLQKPFDARMLLVVNLGVKEDPILIIDFEGRDNDLKIGTSRIPYSRLAFQGRIVCMEPSMKRGDIEKAKITLRNVRGLLYDFPFTALVSVKNFANPYIRVKGRLHVDAAKLKTKVNDEFVLKGKAVANVSYSGPTTHLNLREFLEPVMKLKADIQLYDVSYREKQKPWVYTINGLAHLNNKDLKFDDLQINSEVGKAEASGKVENFLDYVLGITNGFKANLAIKTESLDLNPFLKQKRTLTIDTMKVLSASAAPDLAAPEKTNSMMEAASAMKKNSSFEFNVGLFARKMRVRDVLATNAHMHLHYLREVLEIHSLAANVCEGKIKGRGQVKNFNSIKADLMVEDVDVKELFRQFENFGQDVVSSENIEGKIFAEASFKSLLDDRMEIAGETMYGEVKLSLKDGHLKNFEPIQNLSSFLFKNRDFNDISFTELNESFIMRGYEMQIDELEIGSSILNLFVVNGLYNFKGNSNINLLVPWSNLKKRPKHFIPRSSGASAEDTKGIKLNFSGPPKQMKISLGHKELTQMRPSI